MPLIRARDLRVTIKEMGFEKGVAHTLELALEELAEIRQLILQLADLASRCIDEVGKLNQINDGMKRKLDELRRIRQQGIEQDGDVSG
jgi:thiamine kinase-like enzyme